MTLDIAGDLTRFFADFATAGTYTPAVGAARAVSVIFDRSYVEVDPISGAPVSTGHPVATVRDSEFTGVAAGDQLAIGASNYIITSVQPDGTGITVLALRKA